MNFEIKPAIKRVFIYLVLALSGILVFSCADDKEDESQNPEVICQTSVQTVEEVNSILSQSTWEWVETRVEGRNGDVVTTPESEEMMMSLAFSLGENIEEIQNGQTVGAWTYRIGEFSREEGAFEFVWLDFNGNIDRTYLLEVCPEVIKLTDASNSLMSVRTYQKK